MQCILDNLGCGTDSDYILSTNIIIKMTELILEENTTTTKLISLYNHGHTCIVSYNRCCAYNNYVIGYALLINNYELAKINLPCIINVVHK